MDELAFVESLFTSEMRAASSIFPSPIPTSCTRVKALCTPPSSGNCSLVPPPPNSLLGGGIALGHYPAPFQPPTSDDTSLFVRLHEDDMFSQLSEQDFADFPSFKKEYDVITKSPSSNSSLLLEPLDLLKGNGEKNLSFSTSAMTLPPSVRSARPLKANGPLASCYPFDTNNPMSMFPFGANTNVEFSAGTYSTFPPSPSSSAWMDDEETHDSIHDMPRVHASKYMVTMTAMMQHPSPASVDMFDPMTSPNSGAWISMLKNSETPLPEERNPSVETSEDCPPFSLTISPPSSWTNKGLKELIVSADLGVPPNKTSRQKRSRCGKSERDGDAKVKAARTSAARTSSMTHVIPPFKTSKGKKCVETGCTRRAQSNSRCKAHGGGARCQYTGPGGCSRSSQGGGFCRAHGGGKRCEFPGCTRGQQRKGRCYVHGGIRKCQHGACEKKDRGNGFCISHGGGKRCEYPTCSRAVRRGLLCQIHESQATMEKEQRGTGLV
ncbi:hypothetical protein PsorP6_006961 [Peronosclerospora sorghi]|uniref:Uncharacterized protein n=1 Tax=Peronosclerospora sorghi TaxID=230839 RepID=A0ACC0WDS6_9STRA|nr:hypothetical protein PsorP6_006961 [Peronosclerospora sorghi]